MSYSPFKLTSMKTTTANLSNLDELRYELKIKYPVLTDTDLDCKNGQVEEMLRMVEYKLRKTKQEMREIIAEL